MFSPKLTLPAGLSLVAGLFMLACGPTDDPNGNETTEVVDPPGETIQSELSRVENPDVDDAAFADFTADNRGFAFDLVDQLRAEDEDENVFLSPHSISIALAMMYAGAENDTRDQMADVMRFQLDDDQLHPAFNRLDLELDTRSETELDDDESLQLDVINQTWSHHDFDFVDDYLDLLAEHYGASQRVVDFENDYDEVREGINEWVEYQTEDRIENLLPQGSLSDLTRFVLVNAIYFYGTWEEPFSEDATFDSTFTKLDGSSVDVSLMSQDRVYDAYHVDDADTVGISIPYSGGDISMIAVMPADEDDDFQQWEQDFDREAFDEIVDGLDSQRLDVSFPKFEDEGEYEMSELFEQMGMVDAFDECDADFEGVTGHPPCIDFKSLFIDEVYHQTFVSVDEEGTEAAGATAVVGETPASAPPSVRFDRPFYYAIYDHPTETILFLGRMVDPS